MGGTDGPRKLAMESAALRYGQFEAERRFVGGPLDGQVKDLPPSQDRFYVVDVDQAMAYLFPEGTDRPTDSGPRSGTYELWMNYRRERVMRWLGWDDERAYNLFVADNASPDAND